MFEECKTCEYIKIIPGFRVKEYITKLDKVHIHKIEEDAICKKYNKNIIISNNIKKYNNDNDNESFILFPNR